MILGGMCYKDVMLESIAVYCSAKKASELGKEIPPARKERGKLLLLSLKQEPSVRAAPVAWRRKRKTGQLTAIRVAARHVYRSGYSCFPVGEFLVL